jgi:hypothetical protein
MEDSGAVVDQVDDWARIVNQRSKRITNTGTRKDAIVFKVCACLRDFASAVA